jgi:hypothetical protein
MKSKRYRRSGHPLTQAIDTSIDAREAAGHPVTTGDVAGDLVSTVPAALMFTEFARLVTGRVRARLKARGMMLSSDSTWDRKVDTDITDQEFKVTLRIKGAHIVSVQRRLAADVAVGKFLDKQALRLGRPVTMGEFEAEIDNIYARHGF